MFRRSMAVSALFGLAGLGCAQFLHGTAGSSSYANVSESVQYTPMIGGAETVESYFGAVNGIPNMALSNSHSFAGVIVPGTGGTTDGSEGATVHDSLINSASAASFSAQLYAQGTLSTTMTGSGSERDVRATDSGAAQDNLLFSLTGLTNLTIAGTSTLSTGPTQAKLWLTNLATHATTYFSNNASGGFQQSLTLAAGDYSLCGLTTATPGFDFNAFQGVLMDARGTWTSSLDYTANFSPPSSTPEPFTLGLGVFAIVRAWRFGAGRSGRSPSSPN